MKTTSNPFQRLFLIIIAILLSVSVGFSQENYKGKPWKDSIQQIPGKIQCEFYDLGGEGIAYHDTDTVNSGSGGLNPADGSYFNEFRMKESVDISYTKKKDHVDDNPFNMVQPEMYQLYVGWTNPGEWINYTVNVNKTGIYTVGLMYTANGNGTISLSIDGKDVTGNIAVPSTHQDMDTLAWRQWHHWNRVDNIAQIKLEKGIHVLRLTTVANGNMNYDYLEFKLKE